MIPVSRGGRLFVMRFGAADASRKIVFISGMGAPHDAWKKQIERSVENADCVAFDHRGVGQSEGKGYAVQDMGQDVVDVMDHLGWDSAFVVGHSLGSFVCQHLLLTVPERVRGAVLISTRVVGGWWYSLPTLWGLFYFARMRNAATVDEARMWALKMNYPAAFLESNKDELLALVSGRRETPKVVLNGQLEAARGHALSPDQIQAIRQLSLPLHVLTGEDDVLIPSWLSTDAAEALGATCDVLPGVGHGVMMQAPDAVNRALLQVLSTAKN